MKRFVVLAALTAGMLGSLVPARAADPVEISGTITLGNPARHSETVQGTRYELVPGYTESQARCDPTGAANRIDGVWIAVDPSWLDKPAVLTMPDPNHDVDVVFYKSDCSYIADTTMGRNFIALGRAGFNTNTETGKINKDAGFILLHGFLGKDIAYKLTITP